ncbi:MAG TPA: M20/M25/M40 family metallo-hydrolase [Vicinamibacterales bacterium]|nr:M20/M25/M40 family metallo-hydrolase [Vicinamibacterales bacterium]
MQLARWLGLVVCAAVCVQAQPALRIDADRLMSTVTLLADPRFEGRAAGSPGGIAARGVIAERFRAAGLQPAGGAYITSFTFVRKSADAAPGNGANVIGSCPGKDPKLPVFVVSAHYDHLGVRDGVLYPGADDNASGVAVLLELAAYCTKHPFRRSIVFAAFDAEEGGLNGARAFVASPPVPRERIALNVNLDMVSRSDKREIYAAGTFHTPDLRPPLEQVAKTARVRLLFGHDRTGSGRDDWTSQSDHYAFHAAKIPFVYFGVEDHADYHKPTDTADKIDRRFFVDVAETILDAVIQLDKDR